MRALLLITLLAAPAFAERVDLDMDPAATRVTFTLGDVIHTVHGTFRLKNGNLWFDPATGQAGGLLTVDATSGDSGSGARDSRMNKNVLESSRYPDITFAPDRIDGALARTGDSDVLLHGTFTVHGASHELVMKVKNHLEQRTLAAEITFTVPYVKWGMKDPSTLFLKVKDSVEIEIQATARIK